MFRIKFWFALIVPIVIASMAVPAGASALLYTDRVAWESATSGIFNIDFEGLASSGVPGDYSDAVGLSIDVVQFTGLTPPDNYYLYAQDPATSSNYAWNSGDLLLGPDAGWGGGYIQANFTNGGVTSLGSDVMTHSPTAASFTVLLSTGETFTVVTYDRPNRGFVGFTSDTPITSIRFTPASGWPMIDNFSYGSAPLTPDPPDPPPGETPEADTIILGGTGLLGLWLARRMRRWVT